MANDMTVRARLEAGMRFDVETGSGHHVILDAAEHTGAQDRGPRPIKTLLVALAGYAGTESCSHLLTERHDTQLGRSKDTGGTIRRVGRARRHHRAANPPRHEFARFRRQHGSAGSGAAGTRANLALDNLGKTPGVRGLATDAGSDGSNISLPWTEPSRRATCPALSACVPPRGKADR